jgi:MFS family permease
LPWAAGFILAAALCDGGAIANYLTADTWLDEAQHVAPDLLGLLMVVSTIVYVLTVVAMGSASDRWGPRRLATAGSLTMAAGNLVLMALGTNRAWLVFGLGLKGLAAAMFWPALASWLSRGASPEVLPRRLAAYNLGWCGGQVVGSAAAGLLYETIGARGSFGLYAAACLAQTWLVLNLPDPPVLPAPRHDAPPPQPSSRRRRLDAWLANFAGFFVLCEVRALFEPYARTRLGLGPAAATLGLSLVSAVQLGLFYYLGLVRPGLARGGWLRPAQALAAAGLVALAAGGGAGVMAGLPAIGLLVGVANTASLFHSVTGRDDAATQSGIHETMLGVASILGPVLGGLAAAHWGPTAPWWLGAAVVALALGVSAALRPGD